jgi:hypothetical protein
MKPSHGGNYEKDWGRCDCCGCLRRLTEMHAFEGVGALICNDRRWCWDAHAPACDAFRGCGKKKYAPEGDVQRGRP